MYNIALFVKDFQKGAEISKRLTSMNMNVNFAESIYDLPDKCHIGIIDLDDKKFNSIELFLSLKLRLS